MPTVLRSGPYRLFFFSNESGEPPHVHVSRERLEAKLWLESVQIAWNRGYRQVELRRVARLVEEHRSQLLGSWYAYFGTTP